MIDMTDPEILRAEKFGSRETELFKRAKNSGYMKKCIYIFGSAADDERGVSEDGKTFNQQCEIFSS